MTTLAKLAIVALLSLFASSCMMDVNFGHGKTGNGQVVEETRNVAENFTEVLASEGIDVFVTQDSEFKITVEADENIIDLIGTDVRDGRLKIHAIENIGRATKKVYVSLPKITALKSSSGADLIVQNVIESESIELDASSGSDLRVELSAKEVTADASSGADISVNVSESLVADASSGADIKYTGDASVQTKKSVSGSVRKY